MITVTWSVEVFRTHEVNVLMVGGRGWRTRWRRTEDSKLSSDTLLSAFKAKAYWGEIARVTAILAVGSVRKRESAKLDKIRGTLADGIGYKIKGVYRGRV